MVDDSVVLEVEDAGLGKASKRKNMINHHQERRGRAGAGVHIPIVVAKIPIEVASRVQVEEMVFYSVHNPAPSTSNTTLSSTTTPLTQHYYVHYKV